MPAGEYTYVSSRMIKEIFGLGGSVEGLVPPRVLERMRVRKSHSEQPL
jgi:pantetheine-phosphate adenylyltransferase